MKKLIPLSILFLTSNMVYSADLVFSANQNSNTVSVIDASSKKNIGDIVLGHPASDKRLLSPLYNGQINVHGLAYSEKLKQLAVASTVTNAITLIDTENGKVLETIYVGRNPHEPRYTYNGKEIWVTVRGENYISILDSDKKKEIEKIVLSEGPGMIAFSHDDKYAYVCSSFDDNFWVIDTQTRKIVKTLKVPSSFSPFINTTPNGDEVWVNHKDIGKVTRIDTKKLSIIETFDTGKISNHFAFANDKAYVTVGGENVVKVFAYNKPKAALINTISVASLPHGIWNSADGANVYFVNELSNTMQVIDTKKDVVTDTITIGDLPQALVYAADATSDVDKLSDSLKATVPVFKGPKPKK